MHGIALRYFVEVARVGSLSAASARLFVAVSAISRQIAKLEREVGAPLFERAPRGMVLSEAGHLLLAHARRTLLEADAVRSEIASVKDSPRNEIRIAVSQGPAQGFLPAAMAAFRVASPETRFHLRVTPTGEAMRRVAEGDYDLAVVFNIEQVDGVCVRYQERAPVFAVMAADHPLASQASVSLEDLQRYPLALTGPETTACRLLALSCNLYGLRLEAALRCDYPAVLYEFVRLTDAITLGGFISARERVRGGHFAARPIACPEMSARTLQIQVMEGRLMPSYIERFIDHLVGALEKAA